MTVDPRQITRILTSVSGHNTIFDLQVGNERSKAMIVDWQYEPIKGTLLHIDLKRIAMDQTLRVKVPVQLNGVPEGVKTQGGILEQVLREVEVECLPGDIPSHLDADVSSLVFGQASGVSEETSQAAVSSSAQVEMSLSSSIIAPCTQYRRSSSCWMHSKPRCRPVALE